jgi:hypothetical protein
VACRFLWQAKHLVAEKAEVFMHARFLKLMLTEELNGEVNAIVKQISWHLRPDPEHSGEELEIADPVITRTNGA